MRRCSVVAVLFAMITPVGLPAAERSLEVTDNIERGLRWLANAQSRDGAWTANGGQYPAAMTGLAGMALLMEGSTLKEGRYHENIERAVEWFVKRAQPNGLLADTREAQERSRYMYGQGFGTLFLACAYGEERDDARRKRLEKVLTDAVLFIGKAQTDRGGWGYVSASEGGGFDEGSVTITQLQALRAARNAGIVVPKEVIDKAIKYLKDCTTPRGGIIYSLAHGQAMAGQERPALTAAAVACSFSAGDYNSEYAKKWLAFCKTALPLGGRTAHDEYTHYYYAQVLYILGDDRFGKLFPDTKPGEQLTWSKYKQVKFAELKRQQAGNGSWNTGYIGPVYTTSINLMILQLDHAMLPIYDR